MNGVAQMLQANEFRGDASRARRVWLSLRGICLLGAAILAGGLLIFSAAPAEAQQARRGRTLGTAAVDAGAIAQQVSVLVEEIRRVTSRIDKQLKLVEQERQRLADLVQRLEGVTATFKTNRETVKIGVAAPMSGGDSEQGEFVALGVKEAVAALNAGVGGILGRRMEVIVMDDKSDPAEGAAVAKRMAEQGVRIVIGHVNSGVTLEALKIYADKGVLMITPSATNVKITDQGLWNVFRTCGRDDQQGEVAGKYIAEKFVGKKIAFVHDGTLYGKELAEQTLVTMKGLGLSPVLFAAIDLKQPNTLVEMARGIKSVGADVVYWGGSYEGGKLLRQMRDARVVATMMSGDAIFAPGFAELSGPGGAEGTVMTYHPDWQKRPEAKVLTDRILASNSKSGPYIDYSYAAVQIAVAAANEARTLDTHRIAEVMRSNRAGWPTIIGSIEFDGKGDIKRQDYVIWTWQKGADGRIKPVQN